MLLQLAWARQLEELELLRQRCSEDRSTKSCTCTEGAPRCIGYCMNMRQTVAENKYACSANLKYYKETKKQRCKVKWDWLYRSDCLYCGNLGVRKSVSLKEKKTDLFTSFQPFKWNKKKKKTSRALFLDGELPLKTISLWKGCAKNESDGNFLKWASASECVVRRQRKWTRFHLTLFLCSILCRCLSMLRLPQTPSLSLQSAHAMDGL